MRLGVWRLTCLVAVASVTAAAAPHGSLWPVPASVTVSGNESLAVTVGAVFAMPSLVQLGPKVALHLQLTSCTGVCVCVCI